MTPEDHGQAATSREEEKAMTWTCERCGKPIGGEIVRIHGYVFDARCGAAVLAEVLGGQRVRDNAPQLLREVGGVALALWLTGADEDDALTVAEKEVRSRRLSKALQVVVEELSGEVAVTNILAARDAAHDALAGR